MKKMSLSNIAEGPEFFHTHSVEHFHNLNEGDIPIEDTEHLKEGYFIEPRIYGVRKNKDHLNVEALNNVIYELGIIPLTWPVINDPHFENRTCLPETYYKNNDKERILLTFAENFRQQFVWNYPKRRPLIFEAPNDCGLQKMVCTTIRPTWLLYPEMHTWEGCASFVSDYLDYEPLRKPVLLPERILSPYTVLKRQKGNSFEYATLLASYLIGAKIDAYVVFGYASRDFALGIFNRRPCPAQFDPPEPEAKKIIPFRKYKVNPAADLRSKHRRNREQMRKDALSAKQRAAEEEINRQIQELEKPPHDDLHGWRIHAWVLVLPPGMKAQAATEKEEQGAKNAESKMLDEDGNPIILDIPKIGKNIEVDEPENPREEVEAKDDGEVGGEGGGEDGGASDKENVEEEENEGEEGEEKEQSEFSTELEEELDEQPVIETPFYIEPCTGFKYEIDQEDYLRVESIYNHKNYYVNLQDSAVPENFEIWNRNYWLKFLPEVEDEAAKKQFDMPTSWVERLDISNIEYEERYPGSKKTLRFKKEILEKFSPYSTVDGITKRWCKHGDYAYKRLLIKHEWFQRRPDNLLEIAYDYNDGVITEYFKRGREDYLKEHRYEMSSSEKCIDCNRKLDFFDEPRFDHLSKMTTTPHTLSEEYINREDGLYSRDMEFFDFENTEEDNVHRNVVSITERFHRHPELPATEDVAQKKFNISAMEFRLLYHYEDNFVTKSTRNFYKPNLMDAGGVLVYNTGMTSGYVANPLSQGPKELKKYEMLCKYMKEEEAALHQVRESEKLLADVIRLRALERTLAAERVNLFDVERNEAAKAGLAAKETAEKEAKERELRSEMSPRSAALGLRDFIQTQLCRQNLMQSRYDQLTVDLKEQRLWYLSNQYTISPKDEAEYYFKRELMTFEVETLEVQLERQRVLSHTRYEHLVRLASFYNNHISDTP